MRMGGIMAELVDDEFRDGDGKLLWNVHRIEGGCEGAHCVIHNPSDHHMREWKLVWRDDKRHFERICPHGVGHPDPDSVEFARDMGYDVSVHGCDGCCVPKQRRPIRDNPQA